MGDVHQALRIEVKQGGLPVVDEDGPGLSRPGVPDQPLPHRAVQPVAQDRKPLLGTAEDRLRGGKAPAGGQGPAEVPGMNAQREADMFKLGPLRRRLEIAAVEETGGAAESVVLSGAALTEDDKRIVLVAGPSPDAAHAPHAGKQGPTVWASFQNMLAVKGDEVQILPLEVQAQGGGLTDLKGLPAPVDEPRGPGDDVIVLQHAVIEFHVHPGGGVLQNYHQGLALLPPKGGKSLQGIFSRFHPEGLIPQVGAAAAVGQLQLQSGKAEIPHAAGGILLGKHVQGICPVLSRLLRVGGKAPVHIPDAVGQVAVRHPGTVVGVEQDAAGVRLHLIRGVVRMQGEKALVANYHKTFLAMLIRFYKMELRPL